MKSLITLITLFNRHIKMTEDPFDDNVGDPDHLDAAAAVPKVSLWRMKSYFMGALKGSGEFLSRSENIVHALGSITALCCTDKKGILSWPNASPEKIFVVRKEEAKHTKPAAKKAEDEEHNEDTK